MQGIKDLFGNLFQSILALLGIRATPAHEVITEYVKPPSPVEENKMKINLNSFSKSIPTNKQPEMWVKYAEEFFPLYDITSNDRIAGFMAQTGHESGDYSALSENLNYSWQNLRRVFPRYFPTDAMAKKYERKPEEIANIVYNDANRINKLGNTQPGDGWRFRGAGLIQTTGRWNMTELAKGLGMTPEDAADYCRTARGAMHSACFYWKKNNLNRFCDSRDINGMSKAVNGGTIGLADRVKRWNTNISLQFIQGEYPKMSIGARGDLVKRIQIAVGFSGKDVDGIWGKGTDAAVKEWQKNHKYIVTGVLYPDQLKVMFGE